MKITLSVILIAITCSAHGQFQDKINANGFGTVRALAIDSAARELLVAGDGIISVFDLLSLRQKETIPTEGGLSGMVVTTKGQMITLSRGKIYRTDRSGKSTLLYGNTEIARIQYDSETDRLYALSVDGKLMIFRLNTAATTQPVQTLSPPQKITSVAFSSRQVALGLQSGEILLHKKQTLMPQGSLKGHGAKVVSMTFSADGNLLASSSGMDPQHQLYYEEAILWNVADQSIRFRTGQQYNKIESITLAGDRVILALRSSLKFLTASGQPSSELSTYPYNNPTVVIHGQKLIYGIADTGSASRYLYVVDIPSVKTERAFTFHSNPVWQLNFTQRGDLAITQDNEATGIDKSGNVVFNERIFAHSSDLPFKNDAFMGIGLKKIPDATPDSILLCDFKSGGVTGYRMPRELLERRFSSDFIYDNKSAFILTNKYLLKVGEKDHLIDFTIPVDSTSKILSLINRDDFFNVTSPQRNFIPGSGLFYEYDAEAQVISLRRISDAIYVKQIKGYKIINTQTPGHCIVFHPSDKALYTLDLSKFDLKKLCEVSEEPGVAELSPDKTRLALQYQPRSNRIELINLQTKETKSFSPSAGTVSCLAFAPNGKYLLMGTYSGEIKLWDLKTGAQTGCIFTSSRYKDYVILNDGAYDGTADGIKYLIKANARQGVKQVKNLFKTCITD